MIVDLLVSPFEIPNHITLVCFIQGCKGICNYCYNRELWQIDERKYLKLSIVFDRIRSNNKKYKLISAVSFTGAEPLSRNDFPELIFKFKQEFPDLYYNLDTSLTQGKINDYLLESINKFSISIKDCWSSFPEVQYNLKLLQSSKNVEIRLVLTKQNPEKLRKIIEDYSSYLSKLNVQICRIYPGIETQENQGKFIPLSINEYKELIPEFSSIFKRLYGEDISVIDCSDF